MEVENGPGWISAQAMSQVAGLSFVEPSCMLSLHPKYGPWFSLRAVLIFDAISYPAEAPPTLQPAIPADNLKRVHELTRLAKTGALYLAL
jgi:hypothetical protein